MLAAFPACGTIMFLFFFPICLSTSHSVQLAYEDVVPCARPSVEVVSHVGDLDSSFFTTCSSQAMDPAGRKFPVGPDSEWCATINFCEFRSFYPKKRISMFDICCKWCHLCLNGPCQRCTDPCRLCGRLNTIVSGKNYCVVIIWTLPQLCHRKCFLSVLVKISTKFSFHIFVTRQFE